MNTKSIKCKTIITMLVVISLLIIPFLSCNGASGSIAGMNVTKVQLGNITSDVSIRGKLEMPRESKVCFATTGTIKKIYVTNGSKVTAGTLLAKLDDTSQKLVVAQAQYNVEIALNELAERIYSTLLGYPNYYPPVSVVLRLEQAQNEVTQTRNSMSVSNYKSAMNTLRLAIQDLKASRDLLQPPATMVIDLQDYPEIPKALNLLEENIALLEQAAPFGIQGMIEKGYYGDAVIKLAVAQQKLEYTHSIVNHITGVIKSYAPPYPDTSTAMDSLQQVTESLQSVLKAMEQNNYDEVEVARTLRLAQHYVEISNSILEKNDLTFKHGLNLKQLRLNNLNMEKAEKALDSAKVELMKTELLAPFAGIVVDVPAKENDQISAVDYNARTIVELVDTSIIEMNGVVDEIDISKIADKQTAEIVVDALPNEKYNGKIIFISPYGSLQTGTASFTVKIRLDPTAKLLQRGLSATANIITGKKDNVLLIPNNAAKGTPGKYWVEVVKDKNPVEIEKRYVTLGLQNEDFSEVISGLAQGELVSVPRFHR